MAWWNPFSVAKAAVKPAGLFRGQAKSLGKTIGQAPPGLNKLGNSAYNALDKTTPGKLPPLPGRGLGPSPGAVGNTMQKFAPPGMSNLGRDLGMAARLPGQFTPNMNSMDANSGPSPDNPQAQQDLQNQIGASAQPFTPNMNSEGSIGPSPQIPQEQAAQLISQLNTPSGNAMPLGGPYGGQPPQQPMSAPSSWGYANIPGRPRR